MSGVKQFWVLRLSTQILNVTIYVSFLIFIILLVMVIPSHYLQNRIKYFFKLSKVVPGSFSEFVKKLNLINGFQLYIAKKM